MRKPYKAPRLTVLSFPDGYVTQIGEDGKPMISSEVMGVAKRTALQSETLD